MSHQDIHRHSGNRWVAVVFALSALFLHAVIEKVLTTPSVCYVRVGTDANLLSFPIAIDTTKGCTVQTIWDDHMVKRGTSSVAKDTIGPKLWYQCLNECFFCSYSTGTTSFEALTMPTYGSPLLTSLQSQASAKQRPNLLYKHWSGHCRIPLSKWWFCGTPVEKHARQIGSSPRVKNSH